MSTTGKDLVPLLAEMPSAQDLRRAIKEALEAAYQSARAAIGEVHLPEDTYALQRSLATARERFADYSTAFRDGLNRIKGMQQEMLIEAVGEQAGVPNQGLTIPDAEGDIALSLETANAYDFDLDQLMAAVITHHCAGFGDAEYTAGLEELVRGALMSFLSLGKFEPQITKVNAYAAFMARCGDDSHSAVVRSAATKRSQFKGVGFERKQT